MTGLDTNVLARFILRDDPDQATRADAFIRDACSAADPGWISLVVLCELTWVIGRGYRYPRESVARVLRELRAAPEIVMERADLVDEAIVRYTDGGPGFADHLIAQFHRDAGVTRTVTFDRRASKLPGWELLSTA